MLPGDRLICAFVEPKPVGTEFKKWLLHVTIVPWFRLADDSERIALGLERALTGVEPFEAQVGEEVRFGPKKNRPANLIEPQLFPDVERRVRTYLRKKRSWLVDETTKKHRKFIAHVTFQGDERLYEGDRIFCDRLYIVEQKGDHKLITAEVKLGKATA